MAKRAYVTYLIRILGVIIQHPDQCYSTQVTADRHCTVTQQTIKKYFKLRKNTLHCRVCAKIPPGWRFLVSEVSCSGIIPN